ncbi:MAG: hypothetical protein ABI947_06515 [Chloroflexota bacterium]
MDQQIVSVAAGIVYAAIGAAIGGASVVVVVALVLNSILKSPVLIKALESLADSFPAATRDLLLKAGTLLVEADDGIPEESKTAQ